MPPIAPIAHVFGKRLREGRVVLKLRYGRALLRVAGHVAGGRHPDSSQHGAQTGRKEDEVAMHGVKITATIDSRPRLPYVVASESIALSIPHQELDT